MLIVNGVNIYINEHLADFVHLEITYHSGQLFPINVTVAETQFLRYSRNLQQNLDCDYALFWRRRPRVYMYGPISKKDTTIFNIVRGKKEKLVGCVLYPKEYQVAIRQC